MGGEGGEGRNGRGGSVERDLDGGGLIKAAPLDLIPRIGGDFL